MSKKQLNIKKPRKQLPEKKEDWINKRDKNKRLTFDVPASLHSQLKIASAKTEQNMGQIAIEALKTHLDKIL